MPTSMTRTMVSQRVASFIAVLFMLLVFAVHAARAPAQTTAFTYQGQLTEAGTGANGNYDMQFTLFDIAAGGVQLGPAQAVPTVPVSNGLFTVQLDFGVNAFPGANRFVEIGVRPTGGSGFQTLAPRQQISSTPYAIRTLSAASADSLSSTCTGCVQDTQIQSVAGSKVSGTIPVASVPAGSGNYIQNRTTEQPNASFNIAGNGRIGGNLTVDGTLNATGGGKFIENRTTPQAGANFNVGGNGTVAGTLSAGSLGIGTTSPETKLHIATAGNPAMFLQDTSPNSAQTGFISFRNANLTETAWVGFGTAESPDFSIVNARSGGNIVLLPFSGKVGIGTATPQTKLDVRGDIKLGATGQLFAPGGEEKLRIVRGVISAAGDRIEGAGFTAVHGNVDGLYLVNFTPAFASTPAVMATVDNSPTIVDALFVVNNHFSSASSVQFHVRNPEDESRANRGIHFIAVGPR